MAHTDPITMRYYSLVGSRCVSIGSERTRIEKTLQVAEIPESYNTLSVCVKDAENCSMCSKCMRTLLTMEIAGVIDRYSASFDMDIYRQHRDEYIRKLFQSRDPFAHEIINFAKEKDFSFPRKYFALTQIYYHKNNPNRITRFAISYIDQ
jgi:hypothetical protein